MLRLKGKIIWCLWLVPLLFLGYFLIGAIVSPSHAQDKSSCISCHTSVKDLVKITREIAAKTPHKKSAETKGEG